MNLLNDAWITDVIIGKVQILDTVISNYAMITMFFLVFLHSHFSHSGVMHFPAAPEETGRYAEGRCKHVSVQPFRTKVINQTRHMGILLVYVN